MAAVFKNAYEKKHASWVDNVRVLRALMHRTLHFRASLECARRSVTLPFYFLGKNTHFKNTAVYPKTEYTEFNIQGQNIGL